MTKICTKCDKEKDTTEFYVRKASKDGLMPLCKDCQKKYIREHRRTPEGRKRHNEENAKWRASGGTQYLQSYFQTHKEELSKQNREWTENHPEESRQHKRRWSEKDKIENPDRARLGAARRREDPQVRLKESLRSRLNVAIKEGFKAGSAIRDLGCSVEVLRTHLASNFHQGMTWENYGKGPGCWNIDHIIPLSAFDLTDRQHVVLACHYLNLQPLWFEDNVRKGDKIGFEFRRVGGAIPNPALDSELCSI